jgi:hypothetical protein
MQRLPGNNLITLLVSVSTVLTWTESLWNEQRLPGNNLITLLVSVLFAEALDRILVERAEAAR